MIAPIKHQVIEKDGQPLFVLVPYDEYVAWTDGDQQITIPHAIVERHVLEGTSLVRAWREYKGVSQQEIAEQMEITQSAYSQMEKPEANLRPSTLARIAAVLGVLPEQLVV